MATIDWELGDASGWQLVVNLGHTAVTNGPPPEGELVFSREALSVNGGLLLEPGAVLVTRSEPHA